MKKRTPPTTKPKTTDWFRVYTFSDNIPPRLERIAVVSTTAKTVTDHRGRKMAKECPSHKLFETLLEAKAEVETICTQQIEGHEKAISRTRTDRTKVRSMTKHTDVPYAYGADPNKEF